MLSEAEENGIRTLVLLRTGQLRGFDCSTCSEELQVRRNCIDTGDESKSPVLYDPNIGTYYLCPIKTIPQTILNWVDEYDYYIKFPSAYVIDYQHCNPKWWSAVKLYDSLISEYQNNEHEKSIQKLKSKN